MKYKTIINFHRKNKNISLFLKEGESLSLENIIDVEISTFDKPICFEVKKCHCCEVDLQKDETYTDWYYCDKCKKVFDLCSE